MKKQKYNDEMENDDKYKNQFQNLNGKIKSQKASASLFTPMKGDSKAK